jgi:peptidoglycan hydrolase CwlO-like protein
VQKVIELLNDLSAKAKGMKSAEAVEFGKFSQFCKDTKSNKKSEVERGDVLIESLTAETQKLDSDVAELNDAIANLHKDVASNEAKIKATANQRRVERDDHTSEIQDFGESVDALERAIATLQRQSHDRPQSASTDESLMELKSVTSALPEQARRQVAALLALQGKEEPDFLFREGPQAHGYEFQSGGVVALLKKLHAEFKQKHIDATKEEMNSAHAHEMLSQDLHDSIEIANAEIADKTGTSNEKAGVSAEKKQRLALAVTDRDAAATYLKSLSVECEEKTKSFEEKQGLREDELNAIDQAVEILSSDDVKGASEKYLPAAAFAQKAVALAHLRSSSRDDPSSRTRQALTSFLHSEAKRLHSSVLSTLVDRVTASKEPFTKVLKLIKDLIHNLLQETNQESQQKGWCDKEVRTNTQTRTKLQSSVDSLTAKADEHESSIMEMTQRLSDLAKEVAELQSAMKEAQTARGNEKAENEQTIKDAREAQDAVAKASAILKDFYAGAAKSTAFAQVAATEPVKIGSPEWDSLANPDFKGKIDPGHRAGMQVFGEGPYTGESDAAGGVLAMLEVIASDFSRLELSTSSSEEAAANAHKAFMTEAKKSVAVKDKETEMITNDKATVGAELVSVKKDLAGTQYQLLAADRYYETLKPSCVDTGLTYEKRSQARQAEIQSLEEALRILSGTEFAA